MMMTMISYSLRPIILLDRLLGSRLVGVSHFISQLDLLVLIIVNEWL